MLSVFWDRKGIIKADFLNKGYTMNDLYYSELLDEVRKERRNTGFIIRTTQIGLQTQHLLKVWGYDFSHWLSDVLIGCWLEPACRYGFQPPKVVIHSHHSQNAKNNLHRG